MVQFNLDVPSAQYVGTEEEAHRLLQRLMNKVEQKPDDFIGFDTETHGKKIPIKTKADGSAAKGDPLDWMQDTVTFWSLSAELENYERWCLPVQLLHNFIPLLENKKAQLATWNGKYDAHVCYNSGIYVFGATYFDGLAMASLVDENLQGGLGLKEVAPKEHPFFHPRRRLDRNTHWEDLMKEGLIEEWVPIPMTKFTDLFPKKDPQGKKIVEYEYSIIDLHKHYPDRVSDYASLDAYATLKLVEHLRRVMQVIPLTDTADSASMWDYYMEMEIHITEILWRMERRGLGIDVEYLKGLLEPMSTELLAVEKEIWGLAGWPVNLNSTPDLTQLFFGGSDGTVKRGKERVPAPGLGLEPVKMTKGGKTKLPTPSTDAEVLEELAGTGVEMAKLIKRHRTLQKTKSTYVEAIIRLCDHHKDSRLHPEFKQFGARTGRFSTKTPNSQNFPRPDTDEFHIRSAFVANRRLKRALNSTTGKKKLKRLFKLIVGDYEQLEMRIMAHFSQDEGMLDAIRNGLDLHCVTVEKMYGIPYQDAAKAKKLGSDREKVPLDEKVLNDLVALGRNGPSGLATMAQVVLDGGDDGAEELAGEIHDYIRKRQECKTIGFGIIYGAGGKTIGLQLEIPEEDAEEKIELYFQAFPGVKDYMEYTIAECSEDEFVTTLVGRRRRLPDINHHQFMKRSHAEREAINARIQGTAADIVKAAMINIENDEMLQKWGVKIINQIHDELVMECPEETAELARDRIKMLMEKAFNGEEPLCVPTPCDVKIVDSWDKAK